MAAGGGNLNPVMEDPMESAEVVTLEHQEEMEVLQSIYDGDDRFRAINATTIQYKVRTWAQINMGGNTNLSLIPSPTALVSVLLS